jgi:hypothetical protein
MADFPYEIKMADSNVTTGFMKQRHVSRELTLYVHTEVTGI